MTRTPWKHSVGVASLCFTALALFASGCATTSCMHPGPSVNYLEPVFQVKTLEKTVYGRDAGTGQDLLLFANVPEGYDARNKPAILFFHGWGETLGAANTRAVEFARLGYVTFNVSWTPAGTTDPVDAFANARTAVRWVKSHAAEYGIDTRRIGVFGYSYGGYLATRLAVSDDTDGGVSARVAVVAEMSGFAETQHKDLPEIPAGAFDRKDSPLIIFHGENDDKVPFDRALTIREHCKKANMPFAFVSYPGVGHERTKMFTSEVNGKTGLRWMAEFFAYHLFGERTAATAPKIDAAKKE